MSEFRGILDTGAVRTLLSYEVRQAAGLSRDGWTDVRGVNSASKLDLVSCDLGFLPDGSSAPFFPDFSVRAAVKEPPTDPNYMPSYDVLIGMDVLRRGTPVVDGPAGSFSFEIG